MMTKGRRVWTPEEVAALGVRTSIPIAGEILAGLCKDEAYRLHKRGEFPVPVIKIGRRYVVPVAPILRLLGIGAAEDAADSDPGPGKDEAP
jgi:hypothetical protein